MVAQHQPQEPGHTAWTMAQKWHHAELVLDSADLQSVLLMGLPLIWGQPIGCPRGLVQLCSVEPGLAEKLQILFYFSHVPGFRISSSWTSLGALPRVVGRDVVRNRMGHPTVSQDTWWAKIPLSHQSLNHYRNNLSGIGQTELAIGGLKKASDVLLRERRKTEVVKGAVKAIPSTAKHHGRQSNNQREGALRVWQTMTIKSSCSCKLGGFTHFGREWGKVRPQDQGRHMQMRAMGIKLENMSLKGSLKKIIKKSCIHKVQGSLEEREVQKWICKKHTNFQRSQSLWFWSKVSVSMLLQDINVPVPHHSTSSLAP